MAATTVGDGKKPGETSLHPTQSSLGLCISPEPHTWSPWQAQPTSQLIPDDLYLGRAAAGAAGTASRSYTLSTSVTQPLRSSTISRAASFIYERLSSRHTMKPSGLRLSPSALFSSPYRPSKTSQISPLPDSEKEALSNSFASTSITADPTTPLLPPTPATMEKGRESYPFPGGQSGLWRRSKLAISSLHSSHRGAGRRVAYGTLLILVFVAIYKMSPESSGRYPPSAEQKSGSLWHIPLLPSRPSGTYRPNATQREIDFSSDALPVEASLRERLDVWKNAPGGRGEVPGEIEMGGFVQWNLEQCDTIHEQHNTHMIQKSANVWATMNRTSLHDNRMMLINHMEHVLEKNLTGKYGSGRGIVMVAGNADTLQRVKWSLKMLRSYGSLLPVQIWHFPSESPDPGDGIIAELAELGAELVSAVGYEKDKGKNKSYHLKAIAVVQCPWQEVLYLDSDSIPTRDPEYMFEAPNYKRLGLWATPDYWKTSANNPIWAIMGVKCRNEWEMETGQMFIDKKLHLDVFLLIQYMLENHDWWFYFSDGDKDIFRWAMLALRKRWGVPGRWVGAAALPSGTASGDFCAHTMLQHDSWGEPLFVHYNLLKQIPSGVGRGYSWGRTKQLPLFNLWPATPSTARLHEPMEKPLDEGLSGLGDVDCDMLADANEEGVARSPAKEMIRRRATREQGVKVRYHGGWISALCIDIDYIDPRHENRKEADAEVKKAKEAEKKVREEAWQKQVDLAKAEGGEEPVKPDEPKEWPVRPDWEQSPLEVVLWRDDPNLTGFEKKIYDHGFKPNGKGF